MKEYPALFSWTIKSGGVANNSVTSTTPLSEPETRPISQDIINRLLSIAQGVRHMEPVDIGGDVLECPFCHQFGFEYAPIKHRENCTYLEAKRLMDELYPEEVPSD